MIGSSPLLPRLREKMRRQPSKSKRSEGSSSTLSLRTSLTSYDSFQDSFQSLGIESQGTRAQGNRPQIAMACVPDGRGPGKEAKGRDSSQSSDVECEDMKPQGDRSVIMKVVVPDGKGPGQKLKVRCPDGKKVRAIVPPREDWSFQNCGGEPRPFFLIRSVEPAAAAQPPTEPRRGAPVPRERSSRFQDQDAPRIAVRARAVDPATARRSTEPPRRAASPKECSSANDGNGGRKARFQDSPRMVCQCILSEGVFDSHCPVHGTDAPRRCGRTRPRERDDGPRADPPIDEEELVRRASRTAFRDERRRRRAAEERHASDLARALRDSERLGAEEERRMRWEEERVWNAVGKTRAAEEEARRNEEDLLQMALVNSLAENFSFRSVTPK